jgi:alpha-1,6-mannosyltransferase
MRIVDVCAFYTSQGGGVKTYVERKLQAGMAAGHDVTILAPGNRSGVVELGASGRIVTIAGRRFPLDSRYCYFDDEAALHRALDELDPDFVEASSPWTSAAMVGRWRGRALRALIMHADPLSTYAYRWFGKVASRSAIDRSFDWFWKHLRRLDFAFDMVVSASRNLSDRLRDGGLSRTVTIPMGVEPGIFSPALRDEGLRARLLDRCGLSSEAILLIGAGRFAPEKRWPLVIDAVTAAGIEHPIGIVLIGDGRDQARIVRSAASNPHVQLLAPIADRGELARILASADALVHGCEAETFCMVVSEARASGLPIIVPDQGGAFDQLVAGQGASYRAADVTSLATALKEFATRDPIGERRLATLESAHVRSMDQHFIDLFHAYEMSGGGALCGMPAWRDIAI